MAGRPKQSPYKVPDRIRVAGSVYRVLISDAELEARDQKDCYGCCEHQDSTIVLAEGMSLPQMRRVLWHEVKHAVYTTVGANETYRPRMSEEEAIVRVAAVEVAVLRDNPLLVDFLLTGHEWEWGEGDRERGKPSPRRSGQRSATDGKGKGY